MSAELTLNEWIMGCKAILVSEAWRFKRRGSWAELDDLIQEGYVALINAWRRGGEPPRSPVRLVVRGHLIDLFLVRSRRQKRVGVVFSMEGMTRSDEPRAASHADLVIDRVTLEAIAAAVAPRQGSPEASRQARSKSTLKWVKRAQRFVAGAA